MSLPASMFANQERIVDSIVKNYQLNEKCFEEASNKNEDNLSEPLVITHTCTSDPLLVNGTPYDPSNDDHRTKLEEPRKNNV